jgi:hypothetical protein
LNPERQQRIKDDLLFGGGSDGGGGGVSFSPTMGHSEVETFITDGFGDGVYIHYHEKDHEMLELQ